jgi:hypothetical protein
MAGIGPTGGATEDRGGCGGEGAGSGRCWVPWSVWVGGMRRQRRFVRAGEAVLVVICFHGGRGPEEGFGDEAQLAERRIGLCFGWQRRWVLIGRRLGDGR